ncbi:MAG: hypothetical protein ABR525_04345 [Candidatus Limnocylindria bacterium]
MTPRIGVVHVRDAGIGAHAAILELLHASLPRVGVLDQGTFACDLRGTARLIGAPAAWGERTVSAARRMDVECSIGIASAPFVARVLAERASPGAVSELAAGAERAFLAPLRVTVLPLEGAVIEELALLGIRHVGEFADLPAGAVLDRFGRAAAVAHALAHGDEAPLVHASPPRRRIRAQRAWDDPVRLREQLVFALRAVVDEIAAALVRDGLAALRLGLRLDRAERGPLRFERLILPPSANAAALLRSLRWALEEWQPEGEFTGCALEATEVEPARGRQIGLFAPDGARLEEALAVARHLRSRLGPGRVLRAEVVDVDARLPERAALLTEVTS